MEITRFVIVSAPRTGSNWLCGGLNGHPEVLCHFELFHPERVYAWWELQEELGDLAARNADPRGFLAEVWARNQGQRAVGFKIFPGHDRVALDTVVEDAGVRKILLERRNRIKTFVSEEVAAKTGVYQRLARFHGPPPPPPRIHVDPKQLEKYVERRRRFFADVEQRLTATGQSWLEMSYERLFAGPGGLARIQEYLDVAVDPSQFTIRDLKQNPDDLRLIISNFDELDERLTGNSLRADLHMPGAGTT